ncbi:YbaB/EbfC family nucleoid-associated protein [Lentzea sp. BCCO 10_0061]|uniref:YbaB/EbfC family nucleoid-associated protein n=1 Tax=Lentzea sokolovensis TaxID=3095429 RepID=A0ABU4UQM8_9PSEU|nr:YbaB/EbfC family nucleoid-associated protein [Lentzea sp. BCCO 10_0061]MDX8141106.1 YbaB/EbfC family nucleoid-associated protein [Lentzea sp. BCCO 10_0061]
MIDPEQLLSQYEGKLAEAQAKSDAIRENLAAMQVTERSPDGQITVTVNDAGNLVGLQLGQALQRKDGAAVAQDILRTLQAAQSKVANTVQESMAPLIGADSEAMHMMMDKLRSAQPPPPAEQYVPGGGGGGWGPTEQRLGAIEDDGGPPQARPQQPPQPPRRRPVEDDDDFSDGGFLR